MILFEYSLSQAFSPTTISSTARFYNYGFI